MFSRRQQRARQGRAWILAALAIAGALTQAPGAVATAESIDLTERLTVDATGDYPWVTSSGTAEVDARSDIGRPLQVLDRESDDYEAALEGATVAHWLTTLFSVNPASSDVPRPRPSVTDGRVAITTATSDWIYGYEPDRGLGDWMVRASGDHIHFSIAPNELPSQPAASLPDALALRIRLDLRKAEFLAASMPPDTRVSGEPIEWRFRAVRGRGSHQLTEWRTSTGERFEGLDLTVAPYEEARGFMTTNSGVWFAVGPVFYAAGWLLPFALLALARSRCGAGFPWGRLSPALVTAVALGLLMMAVTVGEQQWRRAFAGTEVAPWLHWESVAVFAVTPTVLAVALVAGSRLRRKPLVVGAVAVAALLIGYVLVRPDPSLITLAAPVLAVLATAAVVLMTVATAGLLVRLGLRAFGASWGSGSLVATAVLAVTLFGSWLWSALSLLHETGEITDLQYAWVYRGALGDVGDALVAGALNYPGWLADGALAWLPFVVLVMAMAGLRESHGDVPRPRPSPAETAVIATVFVAFVAGPWGNVFSISFPITAAVTLAVLAPMLILSYRRDGESPRDGLLAGARAALDRIRSGPGAEGGASDDRTTGHDDADVRQRALATGPTGDWWGNGRRAIRIGVVVAIPFALHYLVLLYTSQGSFLSPDWNPLAPLWALQWLAMEYAFWVAGAFALGALYTVLPGRLGLTKGAVLGLVFALAQGVAELLPGTFDVMSWPAISAEVMAFFVITGVWLDVEALRQHGLKAADLRLAYRLEHWETAVPLVPFVGLIVLVLLQQLISGEASSAISDILQAVPVSGRSLP